jgi:hypothetical protein
MALERAHLLRLHRELHNQIYGHLYHEVTFKWKWRITKTGRALFDVSLRDASSLSVILVCSRLHEEILQSVQTTLTMIRWDGVVHKHDKPYLPHKNGKDRDKKLESAFKHAHNVVVLTSVLHWSFMRKFCYKIRKNCPQVSSIVIGESSMAVGGGSWQ